MMPSLRKEKNFTTLVLLKSHNVGYFSRHSDNKAAIVERFNRTLKTMMWKYFYSKGERTTGSMF